MERSNIKLESIEKTNPFKVPEKYFENFVTNIIPKLPERSIEYPKVIGLWDRVKTWVYMAAMFAGVALMVNLFIKEPDSQQNRVTNYVSEGLNLNSANDIDDFYRYYEDELTKVVYNDIIAGFYGDTEAN